MNQTISSLRESAIMTDRLKEDNDKLNETINQLNNQLSNSESHIDFLSSKAQQAEAYKA